MLLGVGALRWGSQVFFQAPVVGWREPGGSSADCTEGASLSPVNPVSIDGQAPFWDLELSFDNGLRAKLQMFRSCSEAMLEDADAGHRAVAGFKRCGYSVPTQLSFRELGGWGMGQRGLGPLLGEPAKYLPKERRQGPGKRCVCAAQTMPCFMGFQTPSPVGRPEPAPAKAGQAQNGAPRGSQGEATVPLNVSGTLASWLWIVFALVFSVPGRPEYIQRMGV